jgi:hypothetical protein
MSVSVYACPVGPADRTGVGLPALLNSCNEERSLSRGIAPQEHPKGFNWGVFNRGLPRSIHAVRSAAYLTGAANFLLVANYCFRISNLLRVVH